MMVPASSHLWGLREGLVSCATLQMACARQLAICQPLGALFTSPALLSKGPCRFFDPVGSGSASVTVSNWERFSSCRLLSTRNQIRN